MVKQLKNLSNCIEHVDAKINHRQLELYSSLELTASEQTKDLAKAYLEELEEIKEKLTESFNHLQACSDETREKFEELSQLLTP